MLSLDAYTFRARVIPVLLVCLPPLLLLGTGVVTTSKLGIAGGIVISCLAAVAGQLGRDRGRALQPKLWEQWGGGPTVQLLRHRSAVHPDSTRLLHDRIRDVLGDRLPDVAEEERDPAEADSRYEDALSRLRARTRDRERFGLLSAENVNYGQRRNLLGLRPAGIASAAFTLATAAGLFLLSDGTSGEKAGQYAPAAMLALLLLIFWVAIVTPGWVRPTADAYARQLIESVDVLQDDKART